MTKSGPAALPETEIVDAGAVKYLVFKNRDMIGHLVRRDGQYEPELFAVAQILLGAQKPGLVLDIGANIGTFVLPLAKAFPAQQFACFEVQRIVYYQLCANIVLNGVPNVLAHQFGLSNAAGSLDVTLPDYQTESNVSAFSLDPEVRNREYECASVGAVETVNVRTLDSLGVGDVRLIKVDVEGLELKVLMGGVETLRANNFPPIIFEAWTWKPWFQPRREALFAWLKDLGYGIFEVGNNNIAQHPKFGVFAEFKVEAANPAL